MSKQSKQPVDTYNANWWSRLTQSRYFVYILVSPLFLILLAYVIYPFYTTFVQSFGGENKLANYQKFFSLQRYAIYLTWQKKCCEISYFMVFISHR